MKRHKLECFTLVAPGRRPISSFTLPTGALDVFAGDPRGMLWAYFDEDGRLQEVVDGKWLPDQSKNGRPGRWKGKLGLELLDAVAHARAEGAKNTAAAIEMLQKQEGRDISLDDSLDDQWRDYPARYLEKAYVEAKKFWQPYFDRHLPDQDKSFWFPDTKTMKKNRSCS
jgi:hypothetical protein